MIDLTKKIKTGENMILINTKFAQSLLNNKEGAISEALIIDSVDYYIINTIWENVKFIVNKIELDLLIIK